MNDKPTGGRPLPAWGWCGSSNASNSVHGTTTSIVSRNCSRLLFRPYFSKLPWDDNVICRIVLLIHVQLYPSWLWIPHLCRGFLMWSRDVARWCRFDLSVSGPFVCRCLISRSVLRFHIPLIEPDV